MPERPVFPNLGFYTEKISSFIEYHLKPPVQNVKSYIRDTNFFLSKLASFLPFLDDVILCAIDVVGLYPHIPHDEGLIGMREALESLNELAECVLKNNIFEHNLSFYKQLRGTAIGTKMAPPYAIIFFGDLEERLFSHCDIFPLF